MKGCSVERIFGTIGVVPAFFPEALSNHTKNRRKSL